MISVFDHPWLGGLFGDAAAADLWSPQTQLEHFRAFERALAVAMEASGFVEGGHGLSAAAAISSASFDVERLSNETKADGVPVPELVRQLRSSAGQSASAVHTGSTSQDVLDTALSLTLKAHTQLLLARLDDLESALAALQLAYGTRTLLARTRMQAALPITVSDRIDAWRRPLSGHRSALLALRPHVERLQLGGAVGTRAAFGGLADDIANHMAEALTLSSGAVWHSDRSAIADYAGRLAGITGSLGKMGQDIALMAQQGVDEISLSGGGGSSAIPHKSNPILAELLVTLGRFNATQVAGIHQSMIHEQERSGAAWMLEWMTLPSMAMATARSLSAALELSQQVEGIGEP